MGSATGNRQRSTTKGTALKVRFKKFLPTLRHLVIVMTLWLGPVKEPAAKEPTRQFDR